MQYYNAETNTMMDYMGEWIYSCGHRVAAPMHDTHRLSRPCHTCMTAMVGTIQRVKRYGAIPTSGRSTNWATGEQERGVSCYLIETTPRPEFEGRKKLVFRALVVGIGSDDEILIDAATIQPAARRRNRKELEP